MVLEIIQVQVPSGFPLFDSFCYSFHYNSRPRHPSVKHSINRLFLSTRHTFFVIDIFDLPLMVLEIMQVQGPKGFPFLDSICYISHYSSRSRHRRVKHSINRLFLSTRHISVIDKFDLSLMVLEIIQEQGPKGISIPRQPLLYQPL